MSQVYPLIPAPIALFDVLSGVFDPVAGTPVLTNASGVANQRYVVSRAGSWNFVTGVAGSGTALLAGDEVLFANGVWTPIKKGSLGDYLPRDGTLPMTGLLDTGGNNLLLRNAILQGISGASRALLRYVELAAGSWAARQSLLQVRTRTSGAEPSTVPLLTGELAVDLTQAPPPLLVGINGAGDSTVLVGPTRQIELTGTQIAGGIKTIRTLKFGAAGQEMALPTTRGAVGNALILDAGGAIAWGAVQLSANVVAIALPSGGGTVSAAFNATGPYVIAGTDLTFITWQSALYVWSGGPGTFGLGATPAQPDDIVGPILSFAGVAFANLAELQDGVVTGKAIDPAVGGQGYLVKDSDSGQTIASNVAFSGNTSILNLLRLVAAAHLDIEAGGVLTIQDAPRSGTPGLKDAVNRTALDNRFQPSSGSLGVPVAGRAPILDSAGLLNRGVLPLFIPLDYHGSWSPLAPGTNVLRNGVGGGCTPPASPGQVFFVIADGRWNFATGAADPSSPLITTGTQLMLDGANLWFSWIVPGGGGGGGGGSSNGLPRDGSLPMTGDLSFSPGLRILGAAPGTPVLIENAVIDGGVI